MPSKILLWDIETSHDIVAAFGLFHKSGIPHTNILQHWYIISGAWKWLEGNKVEAVSVLNNPNFKDDPTDDYVVVSKLHSVLTTADALVHHYGDRFDIRKFNTRCLYHGLTPVKPPVLIDTYKIAKKAFALDSNRLDFIAEYTGSERKQDISRGLWLEALAGNRKAIKEIVDYNKQDIRVLEDVYLKIRPFVNAHINFNLENNDGCPHCGSTKLHSRGVRRTKTRVYRSYQCQDCGGWSSSTVSEKDQVARIK